MILCTGDVVAFKDCLSILLKLYTHTLKHLNLEMKEKTKNRKRIIKTTKTTTKTKCGSNTLSTRMNVRMTSC